MADGPLENFGLSVPLQAQGVRRGHSFRTWHNCSVCGQSFREDELEWYNGRPYGIPCTDHLDIYSMQAQNEASRLRTNSRARGRARITEG